MKKVIAIFAIATLVACNGTAAPEVSTADTTVKVDSTVVAPADTTAATPEVK